ncbi:hypothetical protein V6N13_016157 [Hibiscus sabdariffa]|uniref:Uncharacterized protein n=1 Tax=Hibiscus sabdariffa TaxID=183260 RepID=A0ABR2NEK2_9ROSI
MDHCWVLKHGHGSIAHVGTGLQSWSIKWADEGLFRRTGSVKTKPISRFKDPRVELKGGRGQLVLHFGNSQSKQKGQNPSCSLSRFTAAVACPSPLPFR